MAAKNLEIRLKNLKHYSMVCSTVSSKVYSTWFVIRDQKNKLRNTSVVLKQKWEHYFN